MTEESIDREAGFAATFLLTLILIRIVISAMTFLIGLYRFLDIWFYIFLLHRVEQVWVDGMGCRANSEKTIEKALVSHSFETSDKRSHHREDDAACPICLVEYVDSEIVYHGPNCHHSFHRECISLWLTKNHSCPYCRQNIIEKKVDMNEDVGLLGYLNLSICPPGA